ncbi:type VI secretion system Vgr family protein [Collimonas humicola]|uniref:type VI secretion system Vgr family protein n=1 Tax=Collimonas humicola TaxID=2825886 RepID=UPI001E3F63B8|nr:type VI secretion system tip protein TssI/VgrG [Collimonas humicola]
MYPNASAMLARVGRFNQDRRLVRIKTPLDADLLLVHRLHGTEALSKPFDLTLELLSPYEQLELKQLVGQPLLLTMQTKSGERHFHGFVREFARTGSDGGMATYQAQLAPWFSFLDYASNCRVFQDLSVLDIAQEVFHKYGQLADYRFDLIASRYPKLSYCVQYNESDFSFVSRLLEDAGIYYSFEHSESGHKLVLADDSTQSLPLQDDATVRFQPNQELQASDVLDDWRPRRRVGASVHSIKSFDFKQPRNPLAVEQKTDVPRGNLPQFERYAYDGSASYGNSAIGEQLSAVRAEEAGWQTKLFEGSGTYRELVVGRYFDLQGHFEHESDDATEHRFIALQIAHDARNNFASDFSTAQDCIYRVEVTALRRKIPFRPLRDTVRPRMPGPQTATVVGPKGEEIWHDKYGRVKLQFHWDRLGQFNDQSSCWVRVASPWAGAGMGGVSAPRIGQEVVVDFLDGNPDRPIITGRVYNADNMPPFGQEVSGMRSKTVRGGGFNEVTMHDTAGGELLNMHAQKDMAVTVLNDHNSTVKNNKATTVAVNHSLNVGANQDISVGGNRGATVTGTDTRTVTGASTATVTGAVTQTYHAGQTRTITAAGYTENITGNHSNTLIGNYSGNTNGDWKHDISGTLTHTVTGAVNQTMHAGREVTVTGLDKRTVNGEIKDSNMGHRLLSVDGDMQHEVSGSHTVYSGANQKMSSASKVELVVGEAGISIDGGEITIKAGGSIIKVNGGGVSINGSKINLNS